MSKRTAVVILYAALLVASILQVFQSIVVAHFFEPEELAPYRYGILTGGFAYLFATGFVDSVFYFISGKYAPNARKYVGNTLVNCSLIFLSILFFFHVLLKPYVLVHTELAPYLSEIGAYLVIILFLCINLTAHNVLVGTDQSAAASGLRLFQYLLRALAIAATLFYGLITSIYQLILLMIFLEAFQTLLYGLALLNRNLLSFHIRGIEAKLQYKYVLSLGIAGLIPFINASLDKIMISAFLGPSSFAIYSISAIELPIAGIIIAVFGSVFFASYVKYAESNDYRSMAQLWHKCSLHGAIVNIPLGISVFLFSDILYQLILPDAYFEGHRVLGIYALLLLLRFNSPDVLAKALDRNTIIVEAAVVSLIVNIIGNLIFIKTLGLWGAALATFLGIATGWIYYLVRYARLLKITVGQLFPWKPYVRLITISVFFFGSARWTFENIGISVTLIFLSLVVYLYYAYFLLERSEKDYIMGWLRTIRFRPRSIRNE